MATSTIKVYGATSWKLYASKLFVVESIDKYLANFTPIYSNSSFQYIKHQLELSINIPMAQVNIMDQANAPVYVSIKNSGLYGKTFYYYVKNRAWRSEETMRLDLVMDVLNTYQEGTDYSFKDNCNILREHKDRFTLTPLLIGFEYTNLGEAGTITVGDTITLKYETIDSEWLDVCVAKVISYNSGISYVLEVVSSTHTASEIDEIITRESGYGTRFMVYKNASNYEELEIDSHTCYVDVYRKIDYISEGINPLLNNGNALGSKIEKSSPLNVDWYLLYRNQDDPSDSLVNPVECYLIPSVETNTDAGYIENGRLIPSFLEEGKYYYFALNSGNATLSNGVVFTHDALNRHVICITRSGATITATLIYIKDADNCYAKEFYDDLTYITFGSLPVSYAKENAYIPLNEHNTLYYLNLDLSFNNSGTENALDPVSLVDKTDAKNIKLIKLPYCPYNFSISGSTIQIDSDNNWNYVSFAQSGGGILNALRLQDMNLKLKSSIVNTSNNPIAYLYLTDLGTLNPSRTDTRRNLLDSKLFNSEFFQPSFYYDSFAFKVQLEKCDLNSYINNTSNFDIDFVMTSTINSKFMFTFKDYHLVLGEENYANIMPIARNNEEALFNVPYINYIRTGFNYDVKQKNVSNASNFIGVGLSMASIGASLLAPSVPLKVAGVVASVVSVAMSVKNTIVSYVNNENSLKQKILQTQNQATSVAGSDDVDLMSEYAENRLKYIEYEPSPVMKSLLNDLFYYCGYASNRMGAPNHHTRVHFDYLQCNASFNNLGNMPEDVVQELINLFKTGITYIHTKELLPLLTDWDMDQTLENWELTLLGD